MTKKDAISIWKGRRGKWRRGERDLRWSQLGVQCTTDWRGLCSLGPFYAKLSAVLVSSFLFFFPPAERGSMDGDSWFCCCCKYFIVSSPNRKFLRVDVPKESPSIFSWANSLLAWCSTHNIPLQIACFLVLEQCLFLFLCGEGAHSVLFVPLEREVGSPEGSPEYSTY